MKRLTVLLIYFMLVLFLVSCTPGSTTCDGAVTHKEYREPAWGIGIGQNNRGTIGAVPMLKPGQYLVTVRISNRDELFSVEQDIYEGFIVGDSVVCRYFGNTFTCTFEED